MRFALASLFALALSAGAFADDAPPKFYLIDGKVTTEKRVESLEKRVAELEKQLAAKPGATAAVTRAACGCVYCTCTPIQAGKPFDPDLNCGSYTCKANGGGRAKVGSAVPPCGCGCMETGSCRCKNCCERTADPNWKAAAAPTWPLLPPEASLPSRLIINGTLHEQRPDGVYYPVGGYSAAPACVGGSCGLSGSAGTFAAPAASGGCPGGNCALPSSRGRPRLIPLFAK